VGFEPTVTYATPVFKTGGATSQRIGNSGVSADAPTDLASCLALLAQISPDLALVVQHWDALPQAVRAGILAMVKASLPQG